jgi:hypothetical protein
MLGMALGETATAVAIGIVVGLLLVRVVKGKT